MEEEEWEEAWECDCVYMIGRGVRDPQVKESKALKASNRRPLRKASTDGAQRNSSNNQQKHFRATQVRNVVKYVH